MPIEIKKEVKPIKHQRFYDIDKNIIGEAYNLHNKFGRFFEEDFYRDNMERVLINKGLEVYKEFNIKLSHKNFIKNYFIDLLVDKSIVYEIKAVERLIKVHKGQLINYLLLTNLNYGQLINFRPDSVEKEFVSTNLNTELRHKYKLNLKEWDNKIVNSDLLVNIVSDILKDWGAFLDYKLYNKAIIFFLGGENKIKRFVKIIDNKEVIGKQQFSLLNRNTGFHISAITSEQDLYEKHIRRLLNYVNLENVQWINFNKHEIKFKTIKK
jgi:GxxExxY protein